MTDEETDSEPEEEAQGSEEPTKSNEDIAREVLAGHWGRGLDRKKRLQEAGYDVAAVSEEISKIYGP